MSSEVVISARDAGKCYGIFKRPEDRLKQMLSLGRRKYYSEYWAFRNVSFDICRGETVAIIGRNGAGKSTLLQTICGTLQPTVGEISVNGRVAALLELGAGFNPEFTGRENVYLAASILGLSTRQINERYDAIAEFAGIGDFISQPVKLYSSGMYARLAFAVAAHVDADILIVDEILSVGDAAFNQKCMRFIQRFKEHGTMLFVSHDTNSVTSLCDRAIWLDRGEVREVGSAKEVAYSYIASLYRSEDDTGGFQIGGSRTGTKAMGGRRISDPRRDLLDTSQHRNAIEIFDFDPDGPWFGNRGATILGARLLDAENESLSVLVGGEEVVLEIEAVAHNQLNRPILGFYVKNHLGQILFGDNTFLTYRDNATTAMPQARINARFHFQMPYLPSGDFSINLAIADGTQADHVQHHWLDDALMFKVHSSHIVRGLVGQPMLDIILAVRDASEAAA